MSKLESIIQGDGKVRRISDDLVIKNVQSRIVCADETELSVQASSYHYCRPRTDEGPYTHVEVGFPSVAPPDTWADYFDGRWGKDDPTDSVYGYVPVELVREFIEAHGGEAA